MSAQRRVVITGVGAVSPCGPDVGTTWSNVVAGRSGIGPITRFDTSQFASRIAGECRDFDPEKYIEKKRVREGDRHVHFAIGASQQAVDDAGDGGGVHRGAPTQLVLRGRPIDVEARERGELGGSQGDADVAREEGPVALVGLAQQEADLVLERVGRVADVGPPRGGSRWVRCGCHERPGA